MSDDKPGWWPKNPYFKSAMGTIKSDKDYAAAIPDTKLRTAVAWYLSNCAWELASEHIHDVLYSGLKEADTDKEKVNFIFAGVLRRPPT